MGTNKKPNMDRSAKSESAKGRRPQVSDSKEERIEKGKGGGRERNIGVEEEHSRTAKGNRG